MGEEEAREGEEDVDQLISTKIGGRKSSCLWKIDGAEYFASGSYPLESPSFGMKSLTGEFDYEWKLGINRSEVLAKTRFLDMTLTLVSVSELVTFPVRTTFNLSFQAPKGNLHDVFLDQRQWKKDFTNAGDSWSSEKLFPSNYAPSKGWNRYPVRAEHTVHEIFYKNSEWKILCQILIGDQIKTSVVDMAPCSSETVPCHLPRMLNELLVGGAYADLTLVVGEERIKAHKLILRASSPVFRAMLDSSMMEAGSSEIVISDFDVETVQAMLHFMYTGETLEGARLEELIPIADKYDLDDLKKSIEPKIYSKMTTNNATEILILADRHHLIGLKKDAMAFINKNKEFVMETEEFQELLASDTKLIAELYVSQK